MRFRWDWLEPVMHAPYVPTLGPVAPGALAVAMFHDTLTVAGTGPVKRSSANQGQPDTTRRRTKLGNMSSKLSGHIASDTRIGASCLTERAGPSTQARAPGVQPAQDLRRHRPRQMASRSGG